MQCIRVCRVDASDEDVVDDLRALHVLTFATTAPLAKFQDDPSLWWIACDDKVPVAFIGGRWSPLQLGRLYLERVGVLPAYTGRGLALRLMRAFERRAREIKAVGIISDCTTDNPASANNFIRAGYRVFDPPVRWGLPNVIYWRKHLA